MITVQPFFLILLSRNDRRILLSSMSMLAIGRFIELLVVTVSSLKQLVTYNNKEIPKLFHFLVSHFCDVKCKFPFQSRSIFVPKWFKRNIQVECLSMHLKKKKNHSDFKFHFNAKHGFHCQYNIIQVYCTAVYICTSILCNRTLCQLWLFAMITRIFEWQWWMNFKTEAEPLHRHKHCVKNHYQFSNFLSHYLLILPQKPFCWL